MPKFDLYYFVPFWWILKVSLALCSAQLSPVAISLYGLISLSLPCMKDLMVPYSMIDIHKAKTQHFVSFYVPPGMNKHEFWITLIFLRSLALHAHIFNTDLLQ